MDWQNRPRCDEAPAWQALDSHFTAHFTGDHAFDLRRAFAQDPDRAQDFGIEAPHLFVDLSRNLIDRQARTLLVQLARECGLAEHRDALLAGAHVNNTEDRPALHPLLRWPAGTPQPTERLKEIHASSLSGLDEMLSSAEQIRLEKRYDDVVHIGIGGSDLGPRLALQALAPQVLPDAPRLHFVANMDGHELAAVLRGLKPERTLFIVASKSFGTAETLRNATSARAWFEAQGGSDLAAHFVALTARPEAARASTLNINSVHGGQAERPADFDGWPAPVVPDSCRMIIDRRYLAEERLETVKAEFRAVVERAKERRGDFSYEIRDMFDVFPSMTDRDAPVVGALTRAIEKTFGRTPQYVVSPGTYDQKHIDRIGRLKNCVAYGPGILDLAHQPDEYVVVQDMVESATVMGLALADLLGIGAD